MTPDSFASGILKNVVDENLGIYKELFCGTIADSGTDAYWQRALDLFQSLSDEHKLTFFEIVRQISIDTASNILGVLDGVNSFETNADQFMLRGSDGVKINEDLQSIFLSLVEKQS